MKSREKSPTLDESLPSLDRKAEHKWRLYVVIWFLIALMGLSLVHKADEIFDFLETQFSSAHETILNSSDLLRYSHNPIFAHSPEIPGQLQEIGNYGGIIYLNINNNNDYHRRASAILINHQGEHWIMTVDHALRGFDLSSFSLVNSSGQVISSDQLRPQENSYCALINTSEVFSAGIPPSDGICLISYETDEYLPSFSTDLTRPELVLGDVVAFININGEVIYGRITHIFAGRFYFTPFIDQLPGPASACPGDSGSPVFTFNQDGRPQLAGLVFSTNGPTQKRFGYPDGECRMIVGALELHSHPFFDLFGPNPPTDTADHQGSQSPRVE